jgi:hypothetical protein
MAHVFVLILSISSAVSPFLSLSISIGPYTPRAKRQSLISISKMHGPSLEVPGPCCARILLDERAREQASESE